MSTIKEIYAPLRSSFKGRMGVLTLNDPRPLSKKQRAWLDIALKLAERESEVEGSQHGAVIIKSGRVLSLGANSWRNQDMRASREKGVADFITTHAEMDALRQVSDAEGCTVFVARVGKGGKEMFSRPCNRCMRELIKAGVKKVVYTVGDLADDD